jgi:hypothetical protein
VLKLRRHHVFHIGIITIGIYLFLFRSDYIFDGVKTEGEVVGMVKARGKQSYYTVPVINFTKGDKVYRFKGVENMDVFVGEIVQVIYIEDEPSKAKVHTFLGFWFTPLIYAIFPLMLLAAAAYSFLSPSHVIFLDLKKLFGISKKGNNQDNKAVMVIRKNEKDNDENY